MLDTDLDSPECEQQICRCRMFCLVQVWNMKDFGLQATQRIVASSNPLKALTEMAQNFPNLAAALSRVAVPDMLRAELKHSQQVVQGGAL